MDDARTPAKDLKVLFRAQGIEMSDERLAEVASHLERAAQTCSTLDGLDLADSPPAVVFIPHQE